MAHRRAHLSRLVAGGGVSALALVAAMTLGAAPASADPDPTPSTPPAAQTRYVAVDGDDGTDLTNDCTDESEPCLTVQYAVDEAADGDAVVVGAGTFNESVFVEGKSLTITGAGAASTSIVGGESGVEGSLGIGIFGTDDPSEDPAEWPTVVLTGLSVSTTPNDAGTTMGVAVIGANVSIVNSIVSDNAAFGVLSLAGSVTLSSSTIADNALGGIIQALGELTVDGSTISGNGMAALEGGFMGIEGSGAGIVTTTSTATITQSTVSNNAIGVILSPMDLETLTTSVIENSTISDNMLPGVISGATDLIVRDTTVSGNGGAGVATAFGSTLIENSTISDTQPVDDFGLGSNQAGVLVPEILAARSAQPSNGIQELLASARDLSLEDFDLGGLGLPEAAGRMSALDVEPFADPSPTGPDFGSIALSGTIVANNGDLPDCLGAIEDQGYNVSSDAENSCDFGGEGSTSGPSIDPMLGELADNGGPTQTQLLLAGSPVIDVIPAGEAGCVEGATDQRGTARPQGDLCDIGAVEFVAPVIDPIVIHPDALPNGKVGTPYALTFTATGGADSEYVWSVAPGTELPDGLTLSEDGNLTGTPTEAGSFSITVSVNDPVLKTYTLVIAPAETTAPTTDAPTTDAPSADPTTDVPTPTADAPTGPLANTGAAAGSLGSIALAAVLGGLVLLVTVALVRRRIGQDQV